MLNTDGRQLTDDLDALLRALPPEILEGLHALPPDRELIEVVMDLGRRPEARFGGGGEQELLEREIVDADIQYVIDHIGSFGEDNRAGIERTLHRISAIRNRSGKIVGLTCRIGRAVFGTIEIVHDLVESGKSILIMGRPGVGKTTMLREAARVLADDLDKRVVVVDTSNEIAGDGDIPHPGIGRARRMQVPSPVLQHAVMIEAVENHMPEVIVIDEIGTELEAAAARTIAERGVQLIGTAHGNNLDNLMLNPTLSDLIGGIQTVTLGDEEARRRRTQKSVLERKAPPTFDVVVEIQDRDRVIVHQDVAETIDAMLRGDPVAPELRFRDEAGVHKTQSRPRPTPAQLGADRFGGLVGSGATGWRVEPGWRTDADRYAGGRGQPGFQETRAVRPGYRPGATGGWRGARGRSGQGGRSGAHGSGREPWERERATADELLESTWRVDPGAAPFLTGEIADRGPVERGSSPPPEPRARETREFARQWEWREAAARALESARVDEGTAPVRAEPAAAGSDDGRRDADPSDAAHEEALEEAFARGLAEGHDDLARAADGDDDVRPGQAGSRGRPGMPTILETLRVLGFGISRKRLEQAVRELQLPVTVVLEVEEADVVITLRNYFRQKAPALREAEERGLPIYVLKSNTIVQMEACLTAIFALDVDPRDAALREVEEAIGIVREQSQPIELSPQNAYIRRLQHEMAERANLLTRSRGREPYRRVRVYPDEAHA